MNIYRLMLAGLLGGVLFVTGCSDSDKDDTPAAAPAAAPAATPSANEQFAALTPSGLKMSEKFTIVGRGTTYQLECNAISGAVSYTFTTSFGASETTASPVVGVLQRGGDTPFTMSVYATNADGINTKTASKNVN